MKRTHKALALVLGICWFTAAALPALAVDTPEIDSPVVDRAGVVSDDVESRLGEQLRAHYDKTGVQMAVLLVESTNLEPIEEYSLRVAERWEGGRAGEDRGVLLTLAIDDRRSRLEVGYGLEDVVTDASSATILRQMRPDLRDQRYADAVSLAVDNVIDRTEHLRPGETPTMTYRVWWDDPVRGFWSAFLFGVFGMVMLRMSRRWAVELMKGKRGWWLTVAGLLLAALVLIVATGGMNWPGYLMVFFWGALLGCTVEAESSYVWGVPFTVYGFGAFATLASPDVGEDYFSAGSVGATATLIFVHLIGLLCTYSVWLGLTAEGGGTGGSTYSSSGSSSSSFSSGGGYSGGGGSFGGGGASGGW